MYTIPVVLLDKLLIQCYHKIEKKDATYPNKTVTQALCGYSITVPYSFTLACNYILGKSM